MTWRRAMPGGRFVVHAGRLIDGVQPEPRLDVDIVIEGNRIVTIEPHAASLRQRRGAPAHILYS